MSCGEEDGDLAPPPSDEAMINGIPVRDVFIPVSHDDDIQAAMVLADDDTSEKEKAPISTTKRISETSVREIVNRFEVVNDSGRVVDASENSTLPPVSPAFRQVTNKTTEPSSSTDNMSQFSSSSCVVRNDEGEESIHKIPRTQEESDQGAHLPVMEHLAEIKTPMTNITIHDLPDDALLEILSYSSLTELIEVIPNVCTRWREFSQYPILWGNKQFCIDKNLSDEDVIKFLQQWPEVRNVDMMRRVESSVIDAICENCTHLEKLKIMYSEKISYSLLKKLVEKCPKIRSLTIPCRFLDNRLKPRILARLQKLHTLKVENDSRKLIPIYVAPFAYGCSELSRLHLFDVSVVDFEQFIRIKCKRLTHATLPWIIDDRRCVVPFLRECASLIRLQLLECKGNYEECFTILGNMSNLRSLTINNLEECPALAFKFLGLAKLQVLYINNSTLDNTGMLAICEGFPNLIELGLIGTNLPSSKGLRRLHLLKKLETLNLNAFFGLRAGGLRYVAQLPKLRKLVLGMHDLKKLQSGLEHILDINNLEILSFGGNPNIHLFPFSRIPEKLLNLRILSVYFFNENVKNVLEQLNKEMPGLKVIHQLEPLIEGENEHSRFMKL